MRTVSKTIILSLTLSLFSSLLPAQTDDQVQFGEEEMNDEGIGSANRAGEQAFLRRYSSQDRQLEQLLLTTGSRIRRRMVFDMDITAHAGSGDYAPFWFTSNRQGLSPTGTSGVMMDLGLNGSMRLPSRFRFGYGFDVAVAANYQSGYYLQQLYVDAGYDWFDISVGSKERWGELVNPSLSSGSLTWSGNSRPIPQIRLEVPEFTRLGILGGWFSLKGHLAYGWYQDSDWRKEQAQKYTRIPEYTDKILHHSKALFMKVGDTERFPLEFIFGLEMYAQFGGTRHNIRMYPDEPLMESCDFPQDAEAYLNILLPVNKGGEQSKENGNTFGSWHIAFGLDMDKWNYRLYYEHFYEDHSSMLGIEYKSDMSGSKSFVYYGMKRNWLDGLFGLEINAPEGMPFSNVVFEILNTKGQCGPILMDGNIIVNKDNPIIKEGVDGKDDMYSHALYKSYTHYGYANGNPTLLSPVYNEDGNLSFRSNRVFMYHLGIDGSVTPNLDYRLMATHTAHWGTYNHPFNEKYEITSVLLECFYHLKGSYSWKFGISAGADFSPRTLLNDNKGIMLTVSKTWNML